MRWAWVAGLFAVLFVVPARSAGADEFSEFRIPRHTWRFATAHLNASLRRDRSSATSQLSEASRGAASGILLGFWSLDSDEWLRTFSAATQFAGTSANDEARSSFPPFMESERDLEGRNLLENVSIAAELRAYPWRAPLGFQVGTRATGSYRQDWQGENERRELGGAPTHVTLSGTSRNSWVFNYDLSYDVAAGWGRVRDATGVYRAFLLERRLMRSGVLSRELSRAALEKLAALYYVEPAYSRVHDRSTKFFWADLEAILAEDGALAPGGFDAYALLQALEPYSMTERSFPRRSGFFIGPRIGGGYRHAVIRDHFESNIWEFEDDSLLSMSRSHVGGRRSSAGDVVFFGALAEYHRPLGMGVQIDVASSVRASTRETERAFGWSSQAVLSYLIADRWEATGALVHMRGIDIRPDDQSLSRWQVMASVELAYYLEDRVRLSLRGSHNQAHDDLGSSREVYRRSEDFVLGLTYHFFRGLHAPGLIEQSMLPPSEPLH